MPSIALDMANKPINAKKLPPEMPSLSPADVGSNRKPVAINVKKLPPEMPEIEPGVANKLINARKNPRREEVAQGPDLDDEAKVDGAPHVLRFTGSQDLNEDKPFHYPLKISSLEDPDITYEFLKSGTVVCKRAGGIIGSTEADEPCLFATKQGVTFYDSREVLSIWQTAEDPCQFQGGCNRDDCKADHPFSCQFGIDCRKKGSCKFLHPELSSVTPVQPGKGRLAKECKYGTACSQNQCDFAHPRGKIVAVRKRQQILLTHSQQLEPLPEPLPLAVPLVNGATKMRMQGEFLLCFTPYPGPWAKEHFKTVDMLRYSPRARGYTHAGTWSLDKHYINCAIAQGRYLLISFWPFEDEALRAVWEGIKVSREQEKQLVAKDRRLNELEKQLGQKEQQVAKQAKQLSFQQQALARKDAYIGQQKLALSRKETYISQQKGALAQKDAYISRQNGVIAQKNASLNRQREAFSRKDAALRAARADQKARSMRLRQERARNERFRLRDPIHLYVMTGMGREQDDWKLVLDYHKGAHDLELCEERLYVTLDKTEFQFDVVVPKNLHGLQLPAVPGRLCPGF